MASYQIKALTKTFLVLPLFVLSGQVFAQELSAETGNEIKSQKVNTSLAIDGLGTSNDYPICHRMKNGVVKHQVQAATTQTAIFE